MDTVKGVIELEGPQEFVEKYLELYRPDASKWQTALLQKGEVKTKEEAPKRTRAARPKAGPSCTERIRTLVTENYFKDLACPPKRSPVLMLDWKLKRGLNYGQEVLFTGAGHQQAERG